MADPIAIPAGVAGVLSAGLQVTMGLYQYYDSWKSSGDDISALHDSLMALRNTLSHLEQKVLLPPFLSKESVDRVTKSVIQCAGAIQWLEAKLKKAHDTKPGLSAIIRRAQYPFREKTLIKIQGIVADLRNNLSLALAAIQVEKLGELEVKVDRAERRAADTETLEILRWLTPINSQAKQSDGFRRHLPGSRRWLFESAEFQAWLSGDTRVLWCPGMPGAGKTITSSMIIDHLEQRFEGMDVGRAYVYCVYNEPSQTVENLLGSLLQQLAQQHVAVLNAVRSLKNRKKVGDRPNIFEISSIMATATLGLRDIYIVVDALDECTEAGNIRRDLVARIRAHLPHLRLLVTSRHIQSIEDGLNPDARIEIRAEDEDLRSFILGEIDSQDQMRSILEDNPSMREVLVDTVLQQASGMFLLAALHMDSLAQEDNLRDLKHNLANLPEGIDATYDEALTRISQQDSRKVARAEAMLIILNCADRPLSVQEVLCALTVRPGDAEFDANATPKTANLLSACCGLVILEEESQKFRLIHYTTERYFNERRLYQDPRAHGIMAAMLLTYLDSVICIEKECTPNNGIVMGLRLFSSTNPALALCDFAILRWVEHLSKAYEPKKEPCVFQQSQQNHLSNLDWDVKDCLLKHMHPRKVPPFGCTADSLAITCCLTSNKIHWAHLRQNEFTLMQMMAISGDVNIVKMLIEWGYDVNEFAAEATIPINSGIMGGDVPTLRYLMHKGVKILPEDRLKAVRLALGCENQAVATFVRDLDEDLDYDSMKQDYLQSLLQVGRTGVAAQRQLQQEAEAKQGTE